MSQTKNQIQSYRVPLGGHKFRVSLRCHSLFPNPPGSSSFSPSIPASARTGAARPCGVRRRCREKGREGDPDASPHRRLPRPSLFSPISWSCGQRCPVLGSGERQGALEAESLRRGTAGVRSSSQSLAAPFLPLCLRGAIPRGARPEAPGARPAPAQSSAAFLTCGQTRALITI